MAQEFKPMQLKPLTGWLDVRSTPGDIAPGSLRWRQNFEVNEDGNLCRLPGWQKFLSQSPYNNQDLHDQLLLLQQYYDETDPVSAGSDVVTEYPSALCDSTLKVRTQGREAPTLLFPSESIAGIRRLFVGTQSRIYQLNESTGNYRIIADGLGGPTQPNVAERRFRAAELQDRVFFTNNYDPIYYHDLGTPVSGCAMNAVSTIPELHTTLEVTQASVIISFSGFILLMNTVEAGERKARRVRWCDLNDGLSWVPGAASLAGFQDLDPGEVIQNAIELGNELIIYTNRRIWRCVVGSTGTFSFARAYVEERNMDRMLVYPNTLVSTGFDHFYMGADGIYHWNSYLPEPERLEWLHKGTGVIFNNIDKACCLTPVAGYDAGKKQVWFSWPEQNQSCVPSKTLLVNLAYPSAHVVDHGFTAFCSYQSDDRPTLRDWLLEYCVCNIAELAANDITFVKEGLPLSECGGSAAACAQAFVPQSIYSDASLPGWEDPRVENYNAAEADEDSLCALVGNLRLDDLCQECNKDTLFVAVSAEDWCLKQMGGVYNRELCANASSGLGSTISTGYCPFTGSYSLRGYYSILRGMLPTGKEYAKKIINRIILDAKPQDQTTPCALKFRIGVTHKPQEPNPGDPASFSGLGAECAVLWRTLSDLVWACQDARTAASYDARNLRPNIGYEWAVYEEGHYLYFELVIANTDGTAALGGSGCFSAIQFDAQSIFGRV